MPATAVAASDPPATSSAARATGPATLSARVARRIAPSALMSQTVVSLDYSLVHQSELTARPTGGVWRCSPPVQPQIAGLCTEGAGT